MACFSGFPVFPVFPGAPFASLDLTMGWIRFMRSSSSADRVVGECVRRAVPREAPVANIGGSGRKHEQVFRCCGRKNLKPQERVRTTSRCASLLSALNPIVLFWRPGAFVVNSFFSSLLRNRIDYGAEAQLFFAASARQKNLTTEGTKAHRERPHRGSSRCSRFRSR